MESITLFVSIVIAVFGILQIILFFKIWGMTNDVAELNRIIKEHLSKQVNSNTFISALATTCLCWQTKYIIKQEILKKMIVK